MDWVPAVFKVSSTFTLEWKQERKVVGYIPFKVTDTRG